MREPLLCLVFAATALAQSEYFPWRPGNVWIYRSGEATRTVEITGIKNLGEQYYFELDSGELLRFTEDGTLVAYEEGQEKVYARFNAREGESYTTANGQCNQRATIVSRAAKYSGPTGSFDNALQIDYSGGDCADAGLIREYYLPWVGLVQRVETSIAGPRTYDLIYARLGDVTVVTASEVSFGLSLDRSRYTVDLMPSVGPRDPAPVLSARISLRNAQPAPLILTFSSGQTYELVIEDEEGGVVYRWSEGQSFTQALRTVAFPAGEKNWVVSVRLAGKDGKPFPAGKYLAKAWLVTSGEKKYAASAPFEVQHVY